VVVEAGGDGLGSGGAFVLEDEPLVFFRIMICLTPYFTRNGVQLWGHERA